MLKSCLRRFGLWPVIAGVTVISIVVSLAITAFVHVALLGIAIEEVEKSVRSGAPFSVALIDVDNFKAVNDMHGHLAGDEVLRALVKACMSQVRASDTFARFGGEEFAVLLPGTDVSHAMQWLERLREHVAQLRVELPEATLSITVSIGLASPKLAQPVAAAHINAALRLADEALYRAKREGKNRVALPLPRPV